MVDWKFRNLNGRLDRAQEERRAAMEAVAAGDAVRNQAIHCCNRV
jgi:hypothetical protein